jgi:hypothetical protein
MSTDQTGISQDEADHTFLKIWAGLLFSVIALAVYAITQGGATDYPGLALIAAFMLVSASAGTRDDYIRSLHFDAMQSVIVVVAVYLVACTIAGIAEPVYSVAFDADADRQLGGLFAYLYDGVLLAIISALAYFSTFLIQHKRASA